MSARVGIAIVLVTLGAFDAVGAAQQDARGAHGGFTGEVKPVLYVTDAEASMPFFRDVLGFDFLGYSNIDGAPYYAELAAGPVKFGIHEPINAEQEERVGQQRLYFRVEDLTAHRSRVAAWGGEPGEVVETDWMDFFIVRDADGHEIVFAITDPEKHGSDPWKVEATVAKRRFGVNVNLFGEVHAGDTVHTFLSELGVSVVRFGVNKGEVDDRRHAWAHIDSTVAIIKSQGAIPLAVLTTAAAVDSATFRSFVRTAIEHVGGEVDYFEVWNEPNGGDREITPALYDQLAEVAIDELHRSGEIAVGPAMGAASASDMRSYIEDRLEANPDFDVVSFHSYGLVSDTRQRADSLALIVGDRPLWLTEVGPPNGTWDEAESNSLLEGLLYEMDLMDVDQLIWWHLFADGDQTPFYPESDLIELDPTHVFQGKNAAFYTAQGAGSVPVSGAAPSAASGAAARVESITSNRTVTEYWSQNTHYFNNSGGTPVSGFSVEVAQAFRLRASPQDGFSRIVECRSTRSGRFRFFKRTSFSCPSGYDTPLTLGYAPTSSDASLSATRPLHEFRNGSNYYYTADPAKIEGIPRWRDNGVFAYVWF